METALAIKVYEVDYSFIVKNYLDKELWGKSWNLFIYKDYRFTISLHSINVKTETIFFEICCDKLRWCSEASIWGDSESIGHNVKNSNIDVLKRQINGAIFKMIENIEKINIVESEGYQQIKESIREERDALREIAIAFLDEEGVGNREIRDAYIEKYVNKNETLYAKKSEYLYDQKYNVLTDVFLVFVKAIKDETKEQKILSALDEAKAESILQEVNEYMEKLETEEYREELKGELEGI